MPSRLGPPGILWSGATPYLPAGQLRPLAVVLSSAQVKTPRVVLGTVHESLVTLAPAPQNVLNWTSVWAQSLPPNPLHADHQLIFLNAHYKMSLFSLENLWGSAVSAC